MQEHTGSYTRHGPEAADFEQTIINKAIDQWSKQAFVKAKGQHFEPLLFMISWIVWTDEMF